MPLVALDHFFVYATDLDASRRFYERVLGLEVGPRPPFGFDGCWLYLGGRPVVHLGAADGNATLAGYLGERDGAARTDTGAVDHIAFQADGFEPYRARLDALGVEYRHRVVPDFDLDQLFVRDPDGVTIELNFRRAPPVAAG